MTDPIPDRSPDEVLVGAKPMAVELFGPRAGKTEVRRIYHWLDQKIIKARKNGNLHTITRGELRKQVTGA